MEKETRMLGARSEEENNENRENLKRLREQELKEVLMQQQNVLVGQQSVLMEQQSLLMTQHNVLMEQQKILMEQQNILMEQYKIVMEQQQAFLNQNMGIAVQQRDQEPVEQQSSSTGDQSSEDPWKIKKVLQDFDLTLRLLVPPRMARTFMLPVLNASDYEIEKGFDVEIWDVDTDTSHSLFFTKKSQAYILVDNWVNDFVFRRGLRKGDEIGLYWDPCKNRFNFSVLNRHQLG